MTKEDIEAIRAIMKEELNPIKEQLNNIETSIGALAEWADDVAVITKVPFAGGNTVLK